MSMPILILPVRARVLVRLFIIVILSSQFILHNAFFTTYTRTGHVGVTKISSSQKKQQLSVPRTSGVSHISGTTSISTSISTSTSLQVSEFHIPNYKESKLPFLLRDEDMYEDVGYTGVLTRIREQIYTASDYSSLIPYQTGHLLHQTTSQIFSSADCRAIINEAEGIGSQLGWTTKRHGNFPSTDIPLKDLPNTLYYLKKQMVKKIYPLLRVQFKDYLPPNCQFIVADAFIVKYDADGGQADLEPHRDGAVVSFNIALNPSYEYEGGGTFFNSLNAAVKIEEGHMITHAAGVLHGGQTITKGKRYILVAFVIIDQYNDWSMRFYNQIRNM
jgi:hypothetical protein